MKQTLFDKGKAVQGVAGRDATDPRLLVALWIYATIEGAAGRNGENHREKADRSAGLDHRSRIPRDEVRRRRLRLARCDRRLHQTPLRGRAKCRTVAVLHAIAHDLLRAATLRAKAAEMGG